MLNRNLTLAGAFALVLVCLLAANFVAKGALSGVSADLTEDKLYTLSSGSKRMLGKLTDDVKVRVFYSRRTANAAPMIRQYADRTLALLEQFRDLSKGKLSIEVIEPRPDTEEEEWAIKYGLQALAAEEPLYFGIVAESEVGAEKSIPFLDPQRESFLEYDLARLIDSASNPERPKIGVMSTLNVLGGLPSDPLARMRAQQPAPAWVFIEELRQSYEVAEVSATASEIEDDIDLLLVIHPKNLAEQAQYAIDQYLLRGGKAMIFTDGHCEIESRTFADPNPQSRFQATFESNLPTLFDAWGIEQVPGKVIGDMDAGASVNTGQAIKKHIVWLLLRPEHFNKDELATSGLDQVTIGSAGVLKRKADAKYKITPLIQSPSTAQEVDNFMVKLGADPDQLAKDYVPGNEKLGIAYRIDGKFSTAFPGGKPESALPREPGEGEGEEDEAAEDSGPPHLSEGEADATVIVVSDVDMISDDFAVRVQNFLGRRMVTIPYDNLNFAGNAIEQLSGSEDLIGLRTRGTSTRPFAKVDQLEAEARQRFQAKVDELQSDLDEVNRKLQEIQQGRDATEDRAVLSPEQVAEIDRFRVEQAEKKKELREVRRQLRQNVEDLGTNLKLINIGLMPVLMILLSFVPGAWRSYKVRSTRD